MYILRIPLAALLAVLSLAGCSSQPSKHAAKQSLPPDRYTYTLDGRPYNFASAGNVLLYYGNGYTNDDYPNTKYFKDQHGSTLNELLPGPRQMAGPIVTNYNLLDPAIRAQADVTQRAISATRQMIAAGQSLNLLPSKLSFMPKPAGASPYSETIDENYGGAESYNFASAYIERRGNTQSLVLVTASGLDNASSQHQPINRFFTQDGITQLNVPYRTTLPGQDPITLIAWSSYWIQPNCNNVREYRSDYSSSCGFIAKSDNQPYDGHANVILVAPVYRLEWRDFYHNSGDPKVYSFEELNYEAPLSRNGKQLVEALNNSGWPFSAPPLPAPLSSTFAELIAAGAAVVGANDIASWPAYSVVDK